jgi:hypothetical protein
MSHDRWRQQLVGEKIGPPRPRTNRVNEIWYEDPIIAWGGMLIHSAEFMGNRRLKAMTQMGRACSRSEAKWNRQGDDGSSPWLEDLKGPSTAPQAEVVIHLFDMILVLNVTWGELSQRLRVVSLLGRIFFESMPSHLHLAFSPDHIVCSALFVPQRDSPHRFWATLLFPLPLPSPCPSLTHCLVRTLTSRPMLGPASSISRLLELKKSSPLQNCVPPSSMDNRQKNHNVPRIVNSQGVKGLLVGLDQSGP